MGYRRLLTRQPSLLQPCLRCLAVQGCLLALQSCILRHPVRSAAPRRDFNRFVNDTTARRCELSDLLLGWGARGRARGRGWLDGFTRPDPPQILHAAAGSRCSPAVRRAPAQARARTLSGDGWRRQRSSRHAHSLLLLVFVVANPLGFQHFHHLAHLSTNMSDLIRLNQIKSD